MNRTLILTCEHGGNRVPAPWQKHFAEHAELLATHRGWDAGALSLAKHLALSLDAPLHFSTTTRLLVDLNRSRSHRSVLSSITRALSPESRAEIFEAHYQPYRQSVERAIVEAARRRPVIHVGVHTFTPLFDGQPRTADVGLLYDPARPAEQELCRAWQRALRARRADLIVRRNYPYLGSADGLTTHLRRRLSAGRYLGIELEVSQRWPRQSAGKWRTLCGDLCESLRACL